MKILHATDTYAPTVGGIEVLVHDLAAHQVAAGHEVTVLTRTPGLTGVSSSGVVVVRDPRAGRTLVAEADTVHAHVSAISPLALRTAELAAVQRIPVVATVHSMWAGAWPVFRAAALARGWAGLSIQWTAVSEAAADPVRRALGGRPVLVLPNAVDTTLWAPTCTRRLRTLGAGQRAGHHRQRHASRTSQAPPAAVGRAARAAGGPA